MNPDSGVGHWIAGFVDGEGCFQARRKGTWRPWPEFEIHVRSDDIAALRLVKETIGVGTISKPWIADKRTGNVAESLAYRVTSKDCPVVVSFFRRFPLRAKKQVDFEAWATFVEAHSSGASNDELRALQAEVIAARQFRKDAM